MLTATGIVSAATVRYALDGAHSDLVFAYGFVLYLLLILLSVPRRSVPFAPLIAFAAFAGVYLSSAIGEGTNDLAMALYVSAGALAYLATQRVFRPLTVAAFALWTPAFRLFGSDPFGGFYPGWVATATILALFFLVLMLLARDASDPDEQLRRIGLGLLGVACVARISERHFVVANPGGIAPDDLWALVVVAVFPVLAVAKLRRPTRDALATGVALGAYVLVGLALIIGKPYHVDSVSVVHRAAELFLQGRDPYRDLDITEALLRFGLDPQLATHLIDGSPLHTFNYPALSFLVPAPFIALGLQDIRYIYLVEVVVLVLVLIRQTAVPWRPLVTAAVVGNAVISRQNILAGVDPLWAVLIACAFLLIARRWPSSILLGLAVATRQPAWYFAPFYLLAVWKRQGRAEVMRRTGIAAVAAILPNLPFFFASPLDFLGGVSQPMLGELEPYGVGLIRFSTDGALPFLPRGAYAALSLTALIVFGLILWRAWRRYPSGVLIFPSAVLWFGWRSLQNYFSFSGIFAMVADEEVMAVESREPPPPPSATAP